MLTAEEIRLILRHLNKEVVVPRSDRFPYEVVKDGFGYSKDHEVGVLQAKLSIMLEAAARREERERG